jgi:hypothetical protein
MMGISSWAKDGERKGNPNGIHNGSIPTVVNPAPVKKGGLSLFIP